MANKTVYPYGQGGQLPSGYPIADDLETNSAQQALAARQGMVLNQEKVGFPENGLNRIPVHIQGNNDTLVYARAYGLEPGRTYRISLLNPDVPVSNLTVGAGYARFNIYYVNRSGTFTQIVNVKCDDLSAPLADYYNITIPDNIELDYILFECRFNLGETLNMYISEVERNVVSDFIAEGTIVGNGDTIVDYDIPISKGDYIHIDFPNGNWATKSSRDNYYKFLFNLYNKVGEAMTYITLFGMCRESWTVPAYGYDFYASPRITASYNTLRLRFRAASGTTVPFVVTRLSKEESKPYFADEISDSVKKVKERQTEASITFGMITDVHYRSLKISAYCAPPFAPYSPLAAILSMRKFASLVRMDNVVCLGDVIEGRQTAYIGKCDASDILEFFSLVGVPLIYAIGNHDSNRYYSQEEGDRIFTQGEIYANFIQQVDERTSLGGSMNGCNYYRDIERHKIRCIVLMSINFSGAYEYTSATRTWLTNALSSMPEGYKAVVFTHIPPPAAHNWSTEGAPTGGAATTTILANNADKIICVFDGHLHLDNVYVKPFISVNMCCQKIYNTTAGTNNPGQSAPEGAWWPIREAGTKNELLWDAVVINQEEGLLSCIRVGAGVDRYIHYAPIEVAPGGTTTLTPAAITADSWAVLASEASAISIAEGVVTVDASATVGSRLMAKAVDTNGNFEYWCIKVVAGS